MDHLGLPLYTLIPSPPNDQIFFTLGRRSECVLQVDLLFLRVFHCSPFQNFPEYHPSLFIRGGDILSVTWRKITETQRKQAAFLFFNVPRWRLYQTPRAIVQSERMIGCSRAE